MQEGYTRRRGEGVGKRRRPGLIPASLPRTRGGAAAVVDDVVTLRVGDREAHRTDRPTGRPVWVLIPAAMGAYFEAPS